jgi:hypothetical protein
MLNATVRDLKYTISKLFIHQLLLATLVVLYMLLLMPGLASADDQILIGAFRWDSWYQDSPEERALDIQHFSNRIPYYAIKNSSGNFTVAGDLENVLRADIDYAYSAGIDYFIFGYYPETGSWGRNQSTMRRLNRALRSYLSVNDRALVKFAISINQSSPDDDLPDLTKALSYFVAQHSYVRTQQGTVPVFIYSNDPKRWISDKGSVQAVRGFFDRIRQDVSERSGVKLTLVLVAADPSTAAGYASDFGLDMTTFYAHAAGHSAVSGQQRDARQCLRQAEDENERALATSKSVIPNVTVGWDFRPAVQVRGADASVLDRRADWCSPYDAKDISEMMREALKEAADLRGKNAFQSVVIYAWNEFVEGGYVSPTLEGGIRTLNFVRNAIGRSRTQDSVTLTWPLAQGGCEIRTDNRETALSACTSTDLSSRPWPCPPGTALLRDEIRAPTGFEAQFNEGGWVVRRCEKAG